jgi:hypothetical protein
MSPDKLPREDMKTPGELQTLRIGWGFCAPERERIRHCLC